MRDLHENIDDCNSGIDRGFGWLESNVRWAQGWPIDPAITNEPRLVATYYALRAYWTRSTKNALVAQVVSALLKAQDADGAWTSKAPQMDGTKNVSNTARAAEILCRLGGPEANQACKKALDFLEQKQEGKVWRLGIEQMRTYMAGGQTIFHNNSICDVLNFLSFMPSDERVNINISMATKELLKAVDDDGYFRMDIFGDKDYSVPAVTWPTAEWIYTLSLASERIGET